MKNEVRARVPRRHGTARAAVAGILLVGVTSTSAVTVHATPPAVTASATTIIGLSEGSSGSNVRLVQEALIAAGIRVIGGADGRFGPNTASAVTEFQVRESLPTSGRIDEFTAAALGLTAAGSTPTTPTSTPEVPTVTLEFGMRGDAVRQMQQQLIDAGLTFSGGADGIFGPGTRRAVSNFQRWNGLPETGIVDQRTAERIAAAAAAANTPTPPAEVSEPAERKEPSPPSQAPAPEVPDDAHDDLSVYVGLSVGTRGDAVKDVQNALLATGLVLFGGADGIFGTATERALQAFQRVNGLDQTGVVSTRTAELLGLGSADEAPVDDAAGEAPVEEAPVDDGAEPDSGPVGVRNPTGAFVGLSLGTRGDEVKELQLALLGTGLTVFGGADGIFGNATKQALIVFQRVNGLDHTGIVSERTAELLGLGTGTAPGYGVLGERSDRVRELQSQLIAWNVEVVGGADGIFGANTAAAIERFQEIHGLTVTGTVTFETAAKLQLPPTDDAEQVGPSDIVLDWFPMQGRCAYGDTWHAPRSGGRLHKGVDLIGKEGLLLYAVVDGEITKQFFDQPGKLHGNGLRLTAPDGTYFTYLHLLDVAPGIEIGTKVKAGDVIGFNGNTGNSATAHLHFEIHPGGGAAINPYPYVKAIDDCENTEPNYQTSYLPAE